MLFTILVFFVVLSILVFVHEAGHFFVAKKLGMGVEEFGFGLPPRIWGKKVGETIYSINWLPIGGFVKLLGEDEADQGSGVRGQSAEKLRRYFFARSKKERSAVLLAGVTMNFILAVIIFSYLFTKGVDAPIIQVTQTLDQSPAQEAGIMANDYIRSIDGQRIFASSQFVQIVQANKGKVVEVVLDRPDGSGKNTPVTLTVTPRVEYPEDQGALGVRIADAVEHRKYPWYQAPFIGLAEAFGMTGMILSELGRMLFRLVTFQGVPREVGGPIAIAQVTGQAARIGLDPILNIMGLLSLNLAIFNVLPIPALDGGRFAFILVEKFIGRRVKPQIEALANQAGMVFLLGLILLVTVNDLLRIFKGN